MALQPWQKVVTPREDLREGRPLDASEFAVHLDHVREGRGPDVYRNPEEFFERNYLTKNLLNLSAEVLNRLSGNKVETSAVFNMMTPFGGGKTHALTLLYHLANNGPAADGWRGVPSILSKADLKPVPKAKTAVFVGIEFDSLTGRGGDDGTPLRKTPWGEIAYQLSGEEGLAMVAEHEKQGVAPGCEVIRKFLPKNEPALILVDELISYMSRNRKSGLGGQMYHFLQNLSEEARGQDNVVLAVSLPASELEMTAEDHADFERLSRLLTRLGKSVIMAAEEETSEIIRRRLFEWEGLPPQGKKTVEAYAEWVLNNRLQLPRWFPIDHAKETFAATYPFHPEVISVFERKWQSLQRFQKTRGILRLLALWVSFAYQEAYQRAHKDPLIDLGTAPLEDPTFRTAMFEQLGENRLEVAVTTDIAGKKDANALRLDEEAQPTVKKARLHRKVANTIFFESNGGQTKDVATVPEIRLGVSEPDLDIGNVETVLDGLSEACYYLIVDKNRYRFGLQINLNKKLADRRATIQLQRIEDLLKAEIQKVFSEGPKVERIHFPEKSVQIQDRPILSLVVLPPDRSMDDGKETLRLVDEMTREHGTSSRTFKSALIWSVPESASGLRDEARTLLAWEDIEDEEDELDESQRRQLSENVKRAQRNLKESIWRTYKNVMLLGKDNSWKKVDLGLVHSSAAESLVALILNRLRQDDDVIEAGKSPSPHFLIRNWPGFAEWSTRAVRDAFFASPMFPRLMNPEAIKDTIARGVQDEILAYVGKVDEGSYKPFYYGDALLPEGVEISDEMFIITADEAKKRIEPPKLTRIEVYPSTMLLKPKDSHTFSVSGYDQHDKQMDVSNVSWEAEGGSINPTGVFVAEAEEGQFTITATAEGLTNTADVIISTEEKPLPPPPPGVFKRLLWRGEVAPQKWMNFYTKVLSKFAAKAGLKLTIDVEVSPSDGVSQQQVDETKVALRELGLDDKVDVDR